jgi:hypothetical protein
MMIPPSTILEMHTFLREELQGQRAPSARKGEASSPGEHHLARLVRTLLRSPRRDFDSHAQGDDHFSPGAIR